MWFFVRLWVDNDDRQQEPLAGKPVWLIKVENNMAEVAERKPAAKPRKKTLTPAEKELRVMEAYVKKITSSKKEAVAFLKRAGAIDAKGEIAPQFRS